MTIEVYLDAFGNLRKVGILRRHAGTRRERVTYEHDREWLKSPDAFQFDPTLPLQQGTQHPGESREMFGTLGDSTPDTWGRRLMDRNERRLAEQEDRPPRTLHATDYLLGVSDETRLGALRFCVDGTFQAQHDHGVPATTALGDLLEAARRIETGEETNEDLAMIFTPGSSLGGARPKASVYDQHGTLSIAKFPKQNDNYSVERWEAVALDMARAAGIRVSNYVLVPVRDRMVFLSQRFDRRLLERGVASQRIPFMSAMAMTEHNDGDSDCSYLELVDAINERGSNPEADRVELFRRIAFTILISNTDDHFRNHGFLWTGKKGWSLSPAYDINPVPDKSRVLSSRIDFEESTASIELLRSVAEYFVPVSTSEAIINECGEVVRNWREFAAKRNAPANEIKYMEPAFEHEDVKASVRS